MFTWGGIAPWKGLFYVIDCRPIVQIWMSLAQISIFCLYTTIPYFHIVRFLGKKLNCSEQLGQPGPLNNHNFTSLLLHTQICVAKILVACFFAYLTWLCCIWSRFNQLIVFCYGGSCIHRKVEHNVNWTLANPSLTAQWSWPLFNVPYQKEVSRLRRRVYLQDTDNIALCTWLNSEPLT